MSFSAADDAWLQYSEESDPDLEPVVRYAQDYLVEVEERLGRRGLFVSGSGVDDKDRYHASFCGAIGLLESAFSEVNDVKKLLAPQ